MSSGTTAMSVDTDDDWRTDLREFLGADPLDGVATHPASGIEMHVTAKVRTSKRRKRSRREPGHIRHRRNDGQLPRLDDVTHALLMDKGIIPYAYQEFALTKAERKRIRAIQNGERRTRNIPAPKRKDLLLYRRAMRTSVLIAA